MPLTAGCCLCGSDAHAAARCPWSRALARLEWTLRVMHLAFCEVLVLGAIDCVYLQFFPPL